MFKFKGKNCSVVVRDERMEGEAPPYEGASRYLICTNVSMAHRYYDAFMKESSEEFYRENTYALQHFHRLLKATSDFKATREDGKTLLMVIAPHLFV